MRAAAWLAAAWLGAAAAAPASAQVSINAEIAKTDVTVDEQVTLSVTLAGPDASLPEPQMPALQSLSIYDSGRSQSLSIVNGTVNSSVVYTFVVIPRAVGKAVIPPISVTYKGETIRTAPIELNVRKPEAGMPGAPGMPRPSAPRQAGQAAPAGAHQAPDLFVTAELDKKAAFVNEQVTLTVRFYMAVSVMQSPQYQPPSYSGFLAEDLPPERHGQTTLHGRNYYYSEVKTALFPAQAGRLTVGSAGVVAVLPPAAADPFSPDFFDRFFRQGGGGRAVRLNSDPLTLTAEPLPAAGKPAGFSGAVGKFSISAAVDRAAVKAGEAVNLTVTVSGEGNLKAIGEPTMPETPQLRFYDTVSSLNLDKSHDGVKGSKVFKTVVVPRVSGTLEIPPISFDYFDPAQRAYKRAATPPIKLNVAPGAADSGASEAGGGPTPATPRGVTAVSRDLRYLKAAPMRRLPTRALSSFAGAGPIHALPFLIFAAALGLTQYRRLEAADPARARSRGALRAAQGRLSRARTAEPAQASALLAETLTRYLADKLSQPASGLSAKRAQELIRARKPNADAALLAGLKQLWEQLDMHRFAPVEAQSMPALSSEVEALIQRLDREVFS